jgi:alpha-N-arabinofuranosidase
MNDTIRELDGAHVILHQPERNVLVHRKILGHFIEHLGRCIENGIWMYEKTSMPLARTPGLERVRQDVLDAMMPLAIPILRWPGGCFSDTYHWKDGIGPRDKRPSRKNIAWGGIKNFRHALGPLERNHFGIMEFLALCDALECEAYINVNYGSGTPEEAAAWVAHVRERSQKTTTWGIANEIYGMWEKGYEKDPERYATRYLQFARAMKAADPSIKLVSVGWNGHSTWNRKLLQRIKDDVDYLSIHLYFGNKPSLSFLLSDKPLPATDDFYNIEINSVATFEAVIEQAIADIDAVYGKDNPRKCKIAFDEWNIWASFGQAYRADIPYYRLVDGIWAALVINAFIRHAEKVEMANIAQLVNTIGLILTYDDKIVVTPQYLAMKMYSDALLDHLLPVTVHCNESITSRSYARDFPAATSPIIDVVATISRDSKAVSVFIVNKHFKEAHHVHLDFPGVRFVNHTGMARQTILTHEDPFAYNTRENPRCINLHEREVAIEGSSLDLDMPPHSASSIQFQIDGGASNP